MIALEVGDVERFPGPEHLASYARMLLKAQQSRSKVRYGKTREGVNRYLKWAYGKAANMIARHQQKYAFRYVGQLDAQIRERKGHQKAVGAVGRHLAEATWWVLRTGNPIRIRPLPAKAGNGGVNAA